jgi:hypothetical protein
MPPSAGCEPVADLACGDAFEGLSNAGEGVTNAFSAYRDCSSGDYSASPELAYRFVADEDKSVTVRGTGDGPLDLIVFELGAEGCQYEPAACVAAAPAEAVFRAEAGKRYAVVWDSPEPDAPTVDDFAMEVTCCDPQCDGRVCGDDGCGTSCGQCDEGVCRDGRCVAAPTECKPAERLYCDSVRTGLSNGGANATMAFADYPCRGANSEEGAYGLSPEVTYYMTVDRETWIDVHPIDLGRLEMVVLKDAGGGCEASEATCEGVGRGYRALLAKPGDTYYFVFDNAAPSWDASANPIGTFGLDIACCYPDCEGRACGSDGCRGSCGACSRDEVCEDGACVLPEVGTECSPAGELVCGTAMVGLRAYGPGSTSVIDDYGCSAFGLAEGRETVYRFESPLTGEVTLQGFTDTGMSAYVLADEGQGCAPPDGTTCVGHGDGTVRFDAEAGRTYYVAMDQDWAHDTSYDLVVTCCQPQCDGRLCGDDGCGGTCGTCDEGFCADGQCRVPPAVCQAAGELHCGDSLAGLSNADAGSVAAFGHYSCQFSPSADFGNSPELIYTLTLDEDQYVSIENPTGPTDDMWTTVLEGACEDTAETCLATGTNITSFNGRAGVTYYLVWDVSSTWRPIADSFDVSVRCYAPRP